MSEKVYKVSELESEEICSNNLTDFLKKSELTISCAESATCGLVAKLLTDRSGSSSWFWGGVESYSNDAKKRILGVSSSILQDISTGPVSSECAREMAEGMRRISGTDVSISVTGIAGPTGAEPGKPVGTVYFGFSSNFRKTETIRVQAIASNRDEMRHLFAKAVLTLALGYAQNLSIIDIAEHWV